MQNALEQASQTGQESASVAFNTAMYTGMAWLDVIMKAQREMQRASLRSLSIYSPFRDARISGELPHQPEGEQVVPVGEERLNVAAATVQGETTRIRRRVVSQPVEQQVVLRDEKVVVERRSPTGDKSNSGVLTETVVEMSDTRQVPKVWKSLHVAEEVVLRKEITERVEKVRETVRRDVIDVEHGREAAPGSAREATGKVALLPRPETNGDKRGPSKAEAPHDKRQGDAQPNPRAN